MLRTGMSALQATTAVSSVIVSLINNMSSDEPVTLTRDVEAAVIPVGNRVALQKGQQAHITQTFKMFAPTMGGKLVGSARS